MAEATRDAYGKAITELGAKNDKVVALDADLAGATKSGIFKAAFPDRFFDFGIAEANMKEAGCDVPIVENGKTFEENSLIKARTVEKACGEITLADDSGLEIDALNGEPGIYSARWMGEDTSYDIKNTEILKRMKDVPEEKRTARFVCVISAVYPDGREFTAKGIFEGRIAHEGDGFPYKGKPGYGRRPAAAV